MQLVQITDVYGEQHYVARADLDGKRVQLPLYFSTGLKVSDGPTFRRKNGLGCASIHRENIAAEAR